MAWLLKTQRRYTTAMERHQAFRFELRENGEQRRQVRRYAGSVRLVYNHALALQTEMYERIGKSHSRFQLDRIGLRPGTSKRQGLPS